MKSLDIFDIIQNPDNMNVQLKGKRTYYGLDKLNIPKQNGDKQGDKNAEYNSTKR